MKRSARTHLGGNQLISIKFANRKIYVVIKKGRAKNGAMNTRLSHNNYVLYGASWPR